VNHTGDARNGYIIVTQTSVTLWDVQNMLISPGFYSNEHYAPYFALNLVGGDFVGLVVRDGPDEPRMYGNIDITQASMLAVLRKN
jgi:hypothetical protein